MKLQAVKCIVLGALFGFLTLLFPVEAGRLKTFEESYEGRAITPEEQSRSLETKREERRQRQEQHKETAKDLADDISSSLLGTLLFPIIAFPYWVAYEQPHLGYAPFPYALPASVYGEGPKDWSQSLHWGYQLVPERVRGVNLEYQVMHKNRLGAYGQWTRFREDLGFTTDQLDLFGVSATANWLQWPDQLLTFGMGIKTLDGRHTRNGPDFSLMWMSFPNNPFSVDLGVSYAILAGDGAVRGLWDLRGRAGVFYRWIHFRAGYRSLRSPGAHLSGPEVSVGVWF